MSIGPYPRLTSLDGAQKNFEDQATKLSRYKAKIAADISGLQSDIEILQMVKISVISAGSGIAVTGASSSPTIAVDASVTSTNGAPSAARRIQLSGYRSLTTTADPGGTAGSPLQAVDHIVEVNGSAVFNVFVPTPASMPPGKVFIIRNNRSDVKGVAVRNTSNQLLFSKYTSLARFSTLTIINTGAAWRALSVTTTL